MLLEKTTQPILARKFGAFVEAMFYLQFLSKIKYHRSEVKQDFFHSLYMFN